MSRARYPDLAGKVVLVTGGATGIGAAHVRGFAENGAKVAFLDIRDDAANALATDVKKSGGAAAYLRCDLLDLEALTASIETVRQTIGPISVLINNAAVDRRQPYDEITGDDFGWMMNVNLRHVVFSAQKVVPQMRVLGQGAIVNTSSVAWMRGIKDLQLYSAAKAAIIGFTNSLAREVGRDRIRVNAIAPGYVSTPRQRELWHDPAKEKELLAIQCLPDLIQPENIADAALFLCSDAGRMITKQCMTINAGNL